jgi:signal transduction histidine kinase
MLERVRTEVRGGRQAEGIVIRIRWPNGEVRLAYVELRAQRDEAGRVTGYLGTLQDITERHRLEMERRQLEEQLHHSQKLEALGTLAGGIAHDLNNTLLPILMLTDLVRSGLPPESPASAQLQTVLDSGRRARDLVGQILAFSRKGKAVKQLVDLGEIVCASLKMLRAGTPAAIAIEQQIEKPTPVIGDASQLDQVLVNLVNNAAHAIGAECGRITVRLASASDGTHVLLTVEDTGSGMDEMTRQRIFEPFFTTKGVGEGTGLGLAVVHGIVMAHGGAIDVTSAPGQGARFVITLPCAA